MSHIFLCYVQEDAVQIQKLYQWLLEAGLQPEPSPDVCTDSSDFFNTEQMILSARIFLACLSKTSVSKRGAFHKALRTALSILEEKPFGINYLIPVRLEECVIPGSLQSSQYNLHTIDLFNDQGWRQLEQVIRTEIQPADQMPISTTSHMPSHMKIAVSETVLCEPLVVTLRFTPTTDGALINWESDVFGIITSTFTCPYDQQVLPAIVKALDAIQYPRYPLQGPHIQPEEQVQLTHHDLWQQGRVSPHIHRKVGQTLFKALTVDPQGQKALTSVQHTARYADRQLRYILRFPRDAVHLAAIPWELLWDDHQALLLSGGRQTLDSCERYLDIDKPVSPPLIVGKKLHILALSPRTGIPMEVRDKERAARCKSWQVLQERGLLNWDELSPVTMMNLDDRFRAGPIPDIIHYYGHGIYKDGQGYLLLDSPEDDTQGEFVSVDRLAARLGGLRLIVLHACQSAMVQSSDANIGLLTGIAPALSVISQAVVAMQLTIRIDAATRFSEVLYQELTRGRSLQAAVADARRSLYMLERDGASWYVPTLYIRTRENVPIYFVTS